MPRFQVKILLRNKDQEDIKLNEEKTICRHQHNKDVKIIWQRFLKCHDKNVSKSNYEPARNKWKTGKPSKETETLSKVEDLTKNQWKFSNLKIYSEGKGGGG